MMKIVRTELDPRDLTDKALQAYTNTDDQTKYYVDPEGVYYLWDRCSDHPIRVGGLQDVIDDLECSFDAAEMEEGE